MIVVAAVVMPVNGIHAPPALVTRYWTVYVTTAPPVPGAVQVSGIAAEAGVPAVRPEGAPGAAMDGAAVMPLTVPDHALNPPVFPAATWRSYCVLAERPVSIALATLVFGAAVHDPPTLVARYCKA